MMKCLGSAILTSSFALVLTACGPAGPTSSPADLVIRGGKVATVDAAFSFAQALAVQGNKIVYVGDDSGVDAYTGPETTTIQLNGELVTPGLVDAHCHPFNLGAPEEDVFDVRDAGSFAEVVERVAAEVATMESGEWLIGSGWSEEDWPDGNIPEHDALSAVSPDNPVFLYRRGGNAAFVNAKALGIAGVTADTPDPYGGVIGKKANGEPSGFLVNMGNNLVKDHFPTPDHPDEWYREVYQRAATVVNAAGLTGWHDAGNEPDQAEIYKQLVDQGELTVRVNMMLQNPRLEDYQAAVEYFADNRLVNYGGEDMFQVRSVKVFFDGALGSRGAAFYEPYADDPGNRGVFEIRPEHLFDVVRAGLETGMQVAPHAIGTRGNGVFLDQVERALSENPVEDHRFRSEHAQTVLPEDVERFVRLGVIPSMQPIHQMYDMEYAEDRLGRERAMESAFVWRSFLDAGAIIPSGSDFTVVPHYPLWGFYSAVTRQDHDGEPEDGWVPEQAMTREEALKSYTIWPAFAAFLEGKSGSLEVGKYADIVVLDRDILTVPAPEILETEVLFTIVNGKIVFEGAGSWPNAPTSS